VGKVAILVGQPLLAVPRNLGKAEVDSQEWLSYKTTRAATAFFVHSTLS
jgi:hypothetical protein